MVTEEFHRWLSAYGKAWESQDPEAAAQLFTDEACYYWTPFEEPKRGRSGIASAWGGAVATQKEIHFRFEILALNGQKGIARWWCSFVRIATGKPVRIEGILQVDFDDAGLCMEFREWWHSDEGRPPDYGLNERKRDENS